MPTPYTVPWSPPAYPAPPQPATPLRRAWGHAVHRGFAGEAGASGAERKPPSPLATWWGKIINPLRAPHYVRHGVADPTGAHRFGYDEPVMFGADAAQPHPLAFERKQRRIPHPWPWGHAVPRGFAGEPATMPAATMPQALPPGTRHPEHTADGNPRPHGHHHHQSRGAASSHHGDDDTFEPNYGAADSGVDLDVSYEAQGGGIDPFAAAVFDDPGAGMAPQEWAALQAPGGIDVYDPRERIPTARNYSAEFGFEDQMYSGFGPAAVIGCEIGCGLDDARLKG